jgi:hypothetical protein
MNLSLNEGVIQQTFPSAPSLQDANRRYAGVISWCEDAFRIAVISAKGGIQFTSFWKHDTKELDSRLRGDDRVLKLSNDTSTTAAAAAAGAKLTTKTHLLQCCFG